VEIKTSNALHDKKESFSYMQLDIEKGEVLVESRGEEGF
jgi:hypothetical protein